MAGSRLSVSHKLKSLPSAVRQSCQQRSDGVQLSHPARAKSAKRNRRDSANCGAHHCVVTCRLDYCNALLYGASVETLEQATASAKQLDESRLSAKRSIRRQTPATLATLSASEALHHLQDVQVLRQRRHIGETDRHRGACKTSEIVSRASVDRSKNQN